MKILYVEDNDDNVYVVRTRLGRAGFTVLVARDGEQGAWPWRRPSGRT